MEKINIAKLLKDCPNGMELDCTICEGTTLYKVDNIENKLYPIHILIKDGSKLTLTKYGQYISGDYAKCVIFPKGKTTWEGFVPPYFKVGDVIQDVDAYKVKITEVDIENNSYVYESIITKGIGGINFSEQDSWKLAPHKFDINTLVPFESKVLVRDANNEDWLPSIWGYYAKKDINYKYRTIASIYRYCIPYEGNEHLLGKTDDCDEYYKSWE